jgi:hypothetical protein
MCDATETNRRNGLKFNIPPPRYTPQNPYEDGFTKEQLDMRRKVEILKYNKSSNYRITKAQSWVQVVNGNFQRRTYSKSYLNRLTTEDRDCENIVTYSTGANIPGPQIPLYLDKNVPLYNYNTQRNVQGINNINEVDMWRTKYDTDLISYSPTIYTLNIRPPIDNTQYKFSVNTSFGIYVRGISNSLASRPFKISISLTSSSVKVRFGGQYLSNIAPIISSPGTINISGNVTSTGNFAGAIYLGNIIMSNIVLYTSNGNTYDIILEPIISATFDDGSTSTITNNITAQLYTNLIDYSNNANQLSNNTKRFGINMTFAQQASTSIIGTPMLSGTLP